jgi:hypothetical protein
VPDCCQSRIIRTYQIALQTPLALSYLVTD